MMVMWELPAKDYQAWCATSGMFSPPEIAAILAMKEAIPAEPGRIGFQTPAGPAAVVGFRDLTGDDNTTVGTAPGVNPEVRTSDVRWIAPGPTCEWLFQRIEEIVVQVNSGYFHLDLYGMRELQLTSYTAETAGHYTAHTDAGYGMQPSRRRKLSLTINLSDPASYDGGELRLYAESLTPVVMSRDLGSIALFRGHVLHEVTPVTRGTRDSLVAWIEGPELR